ncbi:MAG: PASTA domain-containing protein [Chryseolinea sp.]
MNFNFKRFNTNTLGGLLLHLLVAVGIIMVMGVLYFYAYLPNTTNHGETITVPNVEGVTISELERFLVNRNLRYEINDSSYSAEYPPLTVLKQFPHAGSKVKEGRKIFISINRANPPTIPIPNLIDGSVINAVAVLRSNELKLGRVETVAGPFNIVKEMKYKGVKLKAGDRVPKGAVIDLVQMDGGTGGKLEIPDFIEMPYDEAEAMISGWNLNVGEIILVGDTTDGVVLKQKPEPGENIKVGDAVDLWIGKPGTPIPDEDEDSENP